MADCPACSTTLAVGESTCPQCGASATDSTSATTETSLTEDLPSASPSRPSPSRSQSGPTAAGLLGGHHGDSGDYEAGTILAARYRIVGLLGRGGMGQVYRADDLTLGQPVALKFLPTELADDLDRLERFRSEVRVSRQVSHNNVCRVHDIGEADGKVFLSMELVDGGDLSSLLKRVGRLPSDKGLEIARQLCAGLAAAHDRGVLHRDLKPANVMIDSEGRVRIADFGLAGVAGDFAGGEIRCGTPAYMAPETISGKEVTKASDIYALGLVLYELFTGRQPFKGLSVAELLAKHNEETPTSPSAVLPDIDPEIEKVLLLCLEKDPRNRPESALSVSAMLPGGDPLAAMLAAGETPSPELVAQAGQDGRLSPRLGWSLFLTAAVLLIGAAAVDAPRHVLQIAPVERPPEVQLDRARESLEKLGLDLPSGDVVYGFQTDGALALELNRDGVSAQEQESLRNYELVTTIFWLRLSNEPLVALLASGRVSPRRPPRQQPGEMYVSFDITGRLRRLEVVPEELLTTAEPEAAFLSTDWAGVFAAAGLDKSDFEPIAPRWTPPHHLDSVQAWTRREAGPELGVSRIEAGIRNGRIAYLRSSRGFEEQEEDRTAAGGGLETAQLLNVILIMLVLAGGALLARRNLRLGRGDAKGAARLAAVICSIDMIQWLVSADHALNAISEFQLFVLATGSALFTGAFVWLLYVALEPEVRRHWPRRLISWQRLLAKRYRDPMVGRHLLFGVVIGAAMIAVVNSITLVLWLFFPSGSELGLSGIGMITGTGTAVATILAQIAQAVFASLFITVVVLLARLVLRRTWAAVAAAMVVFVGINAVAADPWYLNGAIALALLTAVMYALLRFGLLTLVVSIFTLNLVQFSPAGVAPTGWFPYASILPLLALAALAFVGLIASLGQQKPPGTR